MEMLPRVSGIKGKEFLEYFQGPGPLLGLTSSRRTWATSPRSAISMPSSTIMARLLASWIWHSYQHNINVTYQLLLIHQTGFREAEMLRNSE